ncbi:hypothetical protein HJFPF1_09956 [Paramyrothecium foliicola]|nr:hypothetical protein HJFPF1_09956 [Paramyrothecium foliicola]
MAIDALTTFTLALFDPTSPRFTTTLALPTVVGLPVGIRGSLLRYSSLVKHPARLPWMAIFWMYTNDLPGLMRQGLHWDERNIAPDAEYMFPPNNSQILAASKYKDLDFKYARRYRLSDKNPKTSRGKPSWIASIEVFTYDQAALAEFSIQQLSQAKSFKPGA